MPRAPPPGFFVLTALVVFVVFIITTRHHERPTGGLSHVGEFRKHHDVAAVATPSVIEPPAIETDGAIMGALGNETLKAELGRAAWKLFHTTMARFPDRPTSEESDALKQYIYLFARLYPCGECATHFQQIIKKFPPQTSTRSSAAVWACFVHNEVNKSKGKPEFDCAKIGDFYECGCADEAKEKMAIKGQNSHEVAKGEEVEIQREGPTRGG